MRVTTASRKGIGGVKPKYRCPKCGAYGSLLKRHHDPTKDKTCTPAQRVYAFTCFACGTYDTKQHFEEAARKWPS